MICFYFFLFLLIFFFLLKKMFIIHSDLVSRVNNLVGYNLPDSYLENDIIFLIDGPIFKILSSTESTLHDYQSICGNI